MEYWTVLWITILSGPLADSNSGLIYADVAACEAAIAPVTATLGNSYDYNLICEESVIPSKSIRPKRRPEGFGNG